jgi:beta-phosphoglucomutase-like phosphatase (HAD superfamily)
MSLIKAVLFDMDGVLIDAREWHYLALNRALQLFGKEISREDHLANFDGLPTRKKLERLSIDRGLPPELHEFINNLKQKHTFHIVNEHCHPNFRHEYALSRLKADGYKLALCSNSIRRSVDLMMELSNLKQYFDVTLSNEDVTHAKPHPEIYQLAMKKLGMKAENCLIVEDNDNGIKAATAAGAWLSRVGSPQEVTHDAIRHAIQKSEEDAMRLEGRDS